MAYLINMPRAVRRQKPSFLPQVKSVVLGNLIPALLWCPIAESSLSSGDNPFLFHNLINGFRGLVASNGSFTRYWKYDEDGQSLCSNYTGDAGNIYLRIDNYLQGNLTPLAPWSTYTIVLLFKHYSANSLFNVLSNVSGTFSQFYVSSINNTSISGRAINNTNWTASVDFNISANIDYGKIHLLAVVWDGVSGARRVYIDDHYQEHGGFSGTLSSAMIGDLNILNCSRDTGLYYFAIFSGAATPQQLRELRINPYPELFRPPPSRFILIPSAGGGSYNMTSVVASASSTATAAVNLLRAFQSTVASLSATSAPSLSNLVSLLSPILSLSGTASWTLTVLRTLDSAVNSLSSTNDAAIQIHRALQSAITGTSSTPDTVILSVAGFIALLSTVASQSAVATPSILIQRDMASDVASASSTSTAALQIQRDLLSSLSSTSATATVSLNTTTIIALASAVSSGSLTPNAACTIARALSSVVASTSSTADSAVDVQRNLLTSVASQSETPIALLEALNLIALAGAINSQSSTATPTLDVARALVSDVLSASATATITPAVLRELASALVSASLTGDADLSLAVLGQIDLISSITSTSLTNDKARLLQDLVAAIQTEMALTLSAERPSIQMTDTRPSIILH